MKYNFEPILWGLCIIFGLMALPSYFSTQKDHPQKIILFEELKPQAEYIVIYNTHPMEFVQEINQKIDEGWIAIGNLSVEYPVDENHQFHQAMVKLKE